MQGNFFMQLLIILALLLYSGGSGAQKIIEEVKPVLETLGDDSMKEALKNAEEISSVLSAVRTLSGTEKASGGTGFGQNNAKTDFAQSAEGEEGNAIAFPLKPVNGIIDRDIAYSLSKYVTEN